MPIQRQHNTTILTILLWIIVSFYSTMSAQYQEIKFRHLNIEDGLSSNTVLSLLQDKYGFIWIGTDHGLNRYDGNKVDMPLSKHANASINTLCEGDEHIWIGTSSGLLYYTNSSDSIIRFDVKTTNGIGITSSVSSVTLDKDHNLWVATLGQGAFCIDKSRKSMKQVLLPNKGDRIDQLFVDRKGMVWCVSSWAKDNLSIYNKQKNTFVPYKLIFTDHQDTHISGVTMYQDKKGEMWIGTWDDGLIRFNPDTRKATVAIPSTNEAVKHIHSILENGNNKMMVGSDGGLLIFDSETNETTLHTNSGFSSTSLSNQFVYPLMKDNEGGIWIGTYYGGVDYYHPETSDFRNYAYSPLYNSVKGSIISRICEDKNGNIWIGSDDGGLSVYNKAKCTFTNFDETSASIRNIHALAFYDDYIYIGTYAGGMDIMNINTGVTQHFGVMKNKDGKDIGYSSYAICVDKNKRVWVGADESVCIFNPADNSFTQKKKVEGMVLDIKQEHSGTMWVCSEKELWSYNEKSNKWKTYKEFGIPEHEESEAIGFNCIFEDNQHTLWVGTTSGLFRYDRKAEKFEYVPLTKSILTIMGITGDNHSIWMTTSAGLMAFSISEHKLIQTFTSSDGIDNINFMQNAIFKASDGTIYVGTSHGFTSFNPFMMNHNTVAPHILFTGLDIFNQPVHVGTSILPENLNDIDELRLSYKDNVIRISFSAMSYLMPRSNKYSYYLEGFENEWNDAGNHNSVTYTNLSPGTYTLHVRCTNNDGVLCEKDATLRIVITPPLYWNTYTKILYLLLIIGAIAYFIRHTLKKKEKKHVAEIKVINQKKEQAIQNIKDQKDREIQEISEQKDQEIHEARMKFITFSEMDNEFLKHLEQIIEQHFSDTELSVDFLAKEIGVSRSGLFAKVKSLADITPNEMIQLVRLKHAAKLLKTKNYRINEICYMVGFNSPSYFTKVFFKHFGIKPADYAK